MSRWSVSLILPLFGLSAPAVAQSSDQSDWSGLYVGVDLGLSSGRLRATGADPVFQLTNINPPGAQPLTVVPGTTVSYDDSGRQSGFIYGGVAGFSFNSGNWVLGIEGDAHGPRDSGDMTVTAPKPATALEPAGTYTISRSARISWDWSARGRIGYAWGPTMIYASGGVAGARVRLHGVDGYSIPAGASAGSGAFAPGPFGPITIASSARGTLTGWTASFGGERRLGGKVSLGLDARYSDYGSHNVDFGGCVPNAGCANGSTITGNTITFPAGTTPASISLGTTDAYPGASPGATRVSLNEWRLSARLIFHF